MTESAAGANGTPVLHVPPQDQSLGSPTCIDHPGGNAVSTLIASLSSGPVTAPVPAQPAAGFAPPFDIRTEVGADARGVGAVGERSLRRLAHRFDGLALSGKADGNPPSPSSPSPASRPQAVAERALFPRGVAP